MPGQPFSRIGLDKTVPYIGVMLEKRDTDRYPRFDVPDTYHFTMYRPGMERDWVRIETAVEEFDTEEAAAAYFAREFLPHADSLPRRMIFLCDAAGTPVGTATLWPGRDFGDERQRVHWVAVAPEHQNRGLSKVLLTKVLDLYRELGYTGFVFLDSQTWSYKALRVYHTFGFRPYMGPRPVHWQPELDEETYRQERDRAWAIIHAKWRESGYEP